MIEGIKFTGQEFTRDECYAIFKKYDKSLYDYYSYNAQCFGYNAKNYAQHLYLKNLIKEIFDKYNIKYIPTTPYDYRVFGNFDGYSRVSVSGHQLVVDGKCIDEDDFEHWCYLIKA